MIENAWAEKLQGEYKKPYYRKLYNTVVKEYKEQQVFPRSGDIFKAYDLCPFHKLKVVILGQDPYHNVGQAQGLSFSVQKGIALPPSLQNIFKELQDDLSYPIPKSGDLSHWAEQGVLLLNTVLTVRAHQAFSHRGIGWEEFTDATIRAIEEKEEPVVYILWGSPAQKKSYDSPEEKADFNGTASQPIECISRILRLQAFFKMQCLSGAGGA